MGRRQCMGCMEFYDSRYQICPHCGYIYGTPAAEAYHLKPGTPLQGGRYIVGRVLGFGGFGVTYLGYDCKLKIKIAVKEYLPSEFSTRMPGQTSVTVYSGEREEQFNAGKIKTAEEAVRLAKFRDNPNVVHVFNTFEENHTAYIVMEYCDGESVKSILQRRGTMSMEEALNVVAGVAEALKPVHAEGMIHRDISPDNIYVLKDGTAKLLDFGAARYATTTHSKSLSVIVKPGYAPEEQYRSRGDQGPWTDVYALAATFYKMITGVTPPDAMERASKDTLVRPSEMGVYMEDGMETALMNAMNVAIEDRTQSVDEFISELQAVEVKAKEVTNRSTDVGKLSGRTKVFTAVGFGAAAVLLAAVLLLNPASPMNPFRMPDDTVFVPMLKNLDQETAVQVADSVWLNAEVEKTVLDDMIPEGKVINQSEEPGSQIKTDRMNIEKRTKVLLTVSGGPAITYAPEVINNSLAKAKKLSSEAGLQLEIEEITDMTKAAGTVIAQEPGRDTKMFPGNTLKIKVVEDNGQLPLGDEKNILVPDVTGLDYEEAERRLTGSKLVVNRENEVSDTVLRNCVIRQDTAPGSMAAENQMVLLTVSSGKEQRMVPLVKSLTKEEAEKAVSEAGFIPVFGEEYSSSVKAGSVVRQEPKAQEQQEIGTEVRLIISLGEDPEVTRQREEEGRRRAIEASKEAAAAAATAPPPAAPETTPWVEETLPPETTAAEVYIPETTAAETSPAETAPPETQPPQTPAPTPAATTAAATAVQETTKPYIHTGKTKTYTRPTKPSKKDSEEEEGEEEEDKKKSD